ncbi:hypothetical protein [Sphingomonas sp. MMS24-J13]|uniref:hypothetical protein n=1 Tax=Sphingomonas sp. MMS24-J13 TaxID=3238686 RepID=UPI00384ED727
MTQIGVAALDARAKKIGRSLRAACILAGVAESTVSRARMGADMKIGTFEKLSKALDQLEGGAPSEAE